MYVAHSLCCVALRNRFDEEMTERAEEKGKVSDWIMTFSARIDIFEDGNGQRRAPALDRV